MLPHPVARPEAEVVADVDDDVAHPAGAKILGDFLGGWEGGKNGLRRRLPWRAGFGARFAGRGWAGGALGLLMGGSFLEPGLQRHGEAETAGDAGEDDADVRGAEAAGDIEDGEAGGSGAERVGEFLAESDQGADEAEQAERAGGQPDRVGRGVLGWIGGVRGGLHGRSKSTDGGGKSRYFFPIITLTKHPSFHRFAGIGQAHGRTHMTIDLTDPIFRDEEAARAYFEKVRWPSGPVCPHCGSVKATRMEGEKHRAGLFNCRDCREQFSATVGTVFERSHIPMHKWLLANHLMAASKKGVSAHQLHRMLNLSYKTAWFMAHRIREAMRDENPEPLGGAGSVIEADEAYHGKKEIPQPSRHRRGKPYIKEGKAAEKRPIFALVERRGEARAMSMPVVTGKNIREALVRNADRKSTLHTDESPLYMAVGEEFRRHETVNHSAKDYSRDGVTTNTVEGFFGIFKRGMTGVYQHCGEQHLQRYLDEFTFRYNTRAKFGIQDDERAEKSLRAAEGKRLTYRRINAA